MFAVLIFGVIVNIPKPKLHKKTVVQKANHDKYIGFFLSLIIPIKPIKNTIIDKKIIEEERNSPIF